MRVCILGVLVACGSSDHTIDIAYDRCAPLAVTPIDTSADQRAAIDAGLALWSLPTLGQPGGAAIELRFDDASPAFHGLYDDEHGIIYLNRALALPEVSIVVAHEVGHAFGLPHVSDQASVMHTGNTVTPPAATDQDALDALWGRCNP